MPESEIKVPCDECGEQFNPYLNRKKGWTCPNCKTRQPNLALHYRIVGYLCAAALVWTAFGVINSLMTEGASAIPLVTLSQSILLLLALSISAISREPWRSNGLTALLSLIFFSFLFCNLIGPAVLIFGFDISASPGLLRFMIISSAVLLCTGTYLGWIYASVRRLHLTGETNSG